MGNTALLKAADRATASHRPDRVPAACAAGTRLHGARIVAFLLTALLTGWLSSCVMPAITLPEGYAIVYGISDYAAPQAPLNLAGTYDLSFGHTDADSVAALLESQGYLVIRRSDTTALSDGLDPTAAQMRLDFQTISSMAGPDSRFFFYYAGHGMSGGTVFGSGDSYYWNLYYGGEGVEPATSGNTTEYLILYDAPADVTDPLLSMSDDELASLVATIPSRQKVVVIDACNSGGFMGEMTAVESFPSSYSGEGEGITPLDGFAALGRYFQAGTFSGADIGETDAVVLTAAGEAELSYEYAPAAGKPHGIFTWYFLQTPDAADANYDGFVTVSEAYAFTATSILTVDNELLAGDRKFAPRLSGGAVDFVLFRAP